MIRLYILLQTVNDVDSLVAKAGRSMSRLCNTFVNWGGFEVLVLVRAVSRSWTRCWLHKLSDRCPGLLNPWLTGGGGMWPQVLVLVQAVSRLWTRWCKCFCLVVQERVLGLSGAVLQLVRRNGRWFKLVLVCSWCCLLCRHLMVSARKVWWGDQKWSKKTFWGLLFEELFKDGKTFWD